MASGIPTKLRLWLSQYGEEHVRQYLETRMKYGASCQALASELNCSKDVIYRILRQLSGTESSKTSSKGGNDHE